MLFLVNHESDFTYHSNENCGKNMYLDLAIDCSECNADTCKLTSVTLTLHTVINPCLRSALICSHPLAPAFKSQ
jgi:hypothetical protein